MVVGIDGDMWYCSNGVCLDASNSKIAFGRTLKDAVLTYRDDFNEPNARVHDRFLKYWDNTPEEYYREPTRQLF